MKCSLGFSNFLEEISSLSSSIVFLYCFTLIAEEGFLISPVYSLELCIQRGISFLSFCLLLFFFSQLFVRPPQTTISPFFYIGDGLDHCCLVNVTPSTPLRVVVSSNSNTTRAAIESQPALMWHNFFLHSLITVVSSSRAAGMLSTRDLNQAPPFLLSRIDSPEIKPS